MKAEDYPKVLVCAPQHDSKNYCFDDWADNVNNFTYPNYDVFLADNSPDKSNLDVIREKGFKAQYVRDDGKGVRETMARAHNACRVYALNNKYDFILHLETDVFPPVDVIERLLFHSRKVCGGIYDIFHGKERKLMIQVGEEYDRTVRAYRTVDYAEEREPLFFDGQVKQVYHAGIGCMLIHRSVLSEIKFRHNPDDTAHPDTWFANDCFQKSIPIYVDTDLLCEHRNFTWLGALDKL